AALHAYRIDARRRGEAAGECTGARADEISRAVDVHLDRIGRRVGARARDIDAQARGPTAGGLRERDRRLDVTLAADRLTAVGENFRRRRWRRPRETGATRKHRDER